MTLQGTNITNFTRRKLKMQKVYAIFFVLFSSLMVVKYAKAQDFVQLSQLSDLYCIYLPNGKTQIARGDGSSFRKTGFKSATKKTAKQLSNNRRAIRKLNGLIRKLKKQKKKGDGIGSISAKEFRVVTRFLYEGDTSQTLPPSINDKIASLQQGVQNLGGQIGFNRGLIRLIKRCKRRQVPERGEFELFFRSFVTRPYNAERDLSGHGLATVFAVVPRLYYVSSFFPYVCIKQADARGGNVSIETASAEPCVTEAITSFPGECEGLIETDRKGPKFYLALLGERNIFFSDGSSPGRPSFEEAAQRAEGILREDWGDTVPFFYINDFDQCESKVFQ